MSGRLVGAKAPENAGRRHPFNIIIAVTQCCKTPPVWKLKNWPRYVQERTRYDVRLSQCKLWAGARQCLASIRSYPPLGPPSPQASPPCPRSQGHSPQVKSALFVFVFQGVGPPHAHSGWLFLAFASLRAAYGRRTETWTPVVIGAAIRALFQGEGPQQRGHLPVGETGGLPDG